MANDQYPQDYEGEGVIKRLNAHFAYVVDVMVGDVPVGRTSASNAILVGVKESGVMDSGRILLFMEKGIRAVWRGVQVLMQGGEERIGEWEQDTLDLYVSLQIGLCCGEWGLEQVMGRVCKWRSRTEGLFWEMERKGWCVRGYGRQGRVLVVRTPEVEGGAVEEAEGNEGWKDREELMGESSGEDLEDDGRVGSRRRPSELGTQSQGGLRIDLFTPEGGEGV
ncbi:hypothetical protein BJ508DRAFT_327934 [Ascobolus immersus RN42]|uniref:Uncharacterized protein n=1 Tax=Ascobolus immersus RN42 TaxID=1160509 RepID=A0A3N4I196_ASCIM|nr:hypothetical protein BJ508DRAFT_327934 [Ascobolus immersus RN42]